MYWGENHLHLATSDDLIDWTPILLTDEEKEENASQKEVLPDKDEKIYTP